MTVGGGELWTFGGAATVPGCSGGSTGRPVVAQPGPVAAAVGPEHVCQPRSGGRYGGPLISLAFTSAGHGRNDWTIPVGTQGVTVPVAVTELRGTQVARIWF